MPTKNELKVTTELSTTDGQVIHLSAEKEPYPNSVYFNFTINGKSNGFFILEEDWNDILKFIENNKNG
jgi:hypothetical protein